jgi:hypothetical protein
MKKLKWLLLALVVVLIAAAVGAVLTIDAMARKGVEVGGTRALGVETTCEGAHVGLLSSTVGLEGLTIANPEGYQTDRLAALGSGTVRCRVLSLLGDEAHVHEIRIDSPELTLELKPSLALKNNLGDLLANLKSDGEAPEAETTAKAKTFKVDRIHITNAKVRFHLIGGKTADVTVPDIALTDVRNADGTPLMLADIFGQTLAAIGTSGIHRAKAKGVVPAELLAGFTGTLASAQELLGGSGDLGAKAAALQADLGQHVDSLKQALGALKEGDLKDKAGKLTEGLKGLLDNDDEDQPDNKDNKEGLGGKLKGLLGKD